MISKLFCLTSRRIHQKFLQDSKMSSRDFKDKKDKHFEFLKQTPFWSEQVKRFNSFDNLPITDYSSYKDKILEEFDHLSSPLTGDPLDFWITTSGTSGAPKYFPYSKAFSKSYQEHSLIFFHSLFSSPEALNLKKISVFSAPSLKKTSPAGIPIDYTSYCARSKTSPLISNFLHALPVEIYDSKDDFEKWIYYLAFVADPDMMLFISAHKALEVFNMIQSNFGLYKHYLTRDDVSTKFSTRVSKKRKNYLLDLHPEDLTMNTLWPRLKLISCWKHAACHLAAVELEKKFEGSVADNMYVSTESPLALPLWNHNMTEGGLLSLHNQIIEFSPAEEEPKHDKLLSPFELEEGKKYEVFITNLMGLVRYRLHDVIEVKGFYNNLPLILFSEKTSNYIIIAESYYSQNDLLLVLKGLDLEFKEKFLFIPNKGYTGFELHLREKDYNNMELRQKLESFDKVFSEISDDYAYDLKQNTCSKLIIKPMNPELLKFIPDHFQSKIKITLNKSLYDMGVSEEASAPKPRGL